MKTPIYVKDIWDIAASKWEGPYDPWARLGPSIRQAFVEQQFVIAMTQYMALSTTVEDMRRMRGEVLEYIAKKEKEY